MRKIDRTQINPPESLTSPGCRGELELTRARNHFAQPNPQSFSFAAYKGDDVVAALNELFQGKCAYCESKFVAVTPVDVEHFRPKGAVEQCPNHPGYWWLAAKWENLLASCPDCNRKRRQINFEPGLSLEELEDKDKQLSGKADSFPILGPTYVVNEGGDLSVENPALIDPTLREPNDHLHWVFSEEFCLISPRWNGDQPDPYGLASERTFGLNRQGLVEMRTSLLRSLKTDVAHIERLLDIAIQAPEPVSKMVMDEAMDKFEALYDQAKPNKPYSTMVEAFLTNAREKLFEKYSKLLVAEALPAIQSYVPQSEHV